MPEASTTLDLQEQLDLAADRLRASAEEAHLRAKSAGEPVLAWTSVCVPTEDPLTVFARRRPQLDTRMLFLRPEDRFGLAGIGTAWSYACAGPDRFARAEAAWQRLTDRAVGTGAGGPIVMYGFAFEDAGGAWEGYPAGLLVVPRVVVRWSGNESRLILSAAVDADHPPAEATDATVACVRPGEDQHHPRPTHETAVPLTVVDEFPAAVDWKQAVLETAHAVRSGRLQKAVLARGIRLRGGHLDAPAALRTLRSEYPACTIFAAGRGGRCFLGASPERLVRVREGEVAVAALAGSAARGDTEAADRDLGAGLLRSDKDRVEHALVVDALRGVLAGIATEVSATEAPRLLTMRNTHHLYTPLRAVLGGRRSVFDLIGRLHPTPAVGGVPKEAALAWIRRHERWNRGWYAGPIGWAGADGDGEAAVAIRSALIEEHEARLFAGCGIVADSEPDQEFAESGWKLRPLLSALSGT